MFGASFGQQQNTQQATQPTAGGLFGNTNTAQPAQPTGFTGFGQQQQQQQQQQPAAQGTGLFGATTTAQPPATGGLFGGFGNQAKPAGGLFGATATPATTNPPAAGGLFGSTTTQPQQAGTATGGLFGNTNQPAATQTAPGGGLFGNTAATAATSQPATGGGLFGNQQATGTTTAGTGLFGSTTATTQPVTGGLFGNTQQAQPQGTATQPAQSTNLFGAPTTTTQQQQQTATTGGLGLFGQAKPATTPTGLSLGTSTAPGTQAGGNTTVQASEITGSTKFNDLPEEFKKIFEAVETGIQKQTNIAQELKSKNLGAEPDKGRAQLQRVAKVAIATDNTLSLDSGFVGDLKLKGSQALDELVVATKIVDGFLHPNQYPDNLTVWANFPFAYFSALSDQLSERLQRYKLIVEQIERKIIAASGQAQTSPQAIAQALRAQHSTFMTLAAKTAELDARLTRIKNVYRDLWRAHTGSARDPFDRKNGGLDELGVGGLSVS